MEAKERLAARLDDLKQQWDHAETDELVHLARDLYEGLVEIRYRERYPSERGEEMSPSGYPQTSSESPAQQESPRAQPEHPATPSSHPSASPKSKILIDFNDRWAFVNKLFDRNQDDFNRVVSQLNTMSTYTEARNFIVHVVKPDYNWSDQEEFEVRFMELIERHFS